MNCNNIIPISEKCEDNNLGSIKNAWIADYTSVTSTFDPDPLATDAGEILTPDLSVAVGEEFQKFSFNTNTSSYTENWSGDINADTHLYESSIMIGLRRIDVDKRNAISVLAEGRRKLVVIVQGNNDEFRVFGLDDGMRLTAMESGSNETKNAGTFYTITLSGEDKWQAPFTDQATVDTLTV